MDKKDKTENPEAQSNSEIIEQDAEETENSTAEETVENAATEPAMVKKSAAKLSLLLSLLAVAAVAYLYYQDWQSKQQQTSDVISPEAVQKLQDSDQRLNTEVQNLQNDINQIKQQNTDIETLKQQLEQLTAQFNAFKNQQQQNSSAGSESTFDNSQHESELAEIKLQLRNQARLIAGLQATPSNDQATETKAEELRAEAYEQITKNAATQVLLTTDVLLSTHHVTQAIDALDGYLKVSSLKPVDKNKLLQLLSQLQQIELPDHAQISQQLQALKSTVNALQITTQQSTDEAPKWYERLVSVKKIETESSISSTAQLVSFKTELNRLLYQANLYLMLHDQSGWRSSLKAAVQWVNDEMPEQPELVDSITALMNQSVVAEIPSQVDVSALIAALNRLD